MKKIYSFIVMLCLVAFMSAQTTSHPISSPNFAFSGLLTVNLGHIEVNKPGVVRFSFANTGSGDLLISSVNLLHPNLTSNYTTTPVSHLDSGFVELTFTSSTPGEFMAKATISSNAGDKALTISGIVDAPAPTPALNPGSQGVKGSGTLALPTGKKK